MNLKLEPGEELVKFFQYHAFGKSHVFELAVTNQAVHVRRELFCPGEPFYFERIPHERISLVIRKTMPPYLLWLISVILLFLGVYFFRQVTLPLIRSREIGVAALSPVAVLIGGLLPLIARKRTGILIRYDRKQYKWKPPLVFRKKNRNEIDGIQDEILQVSNEQGIRVKDQKNYFREIVNKLEPVIERSKKVAGKIWDGSIGIPAFISYSLILFLALINFFPTLYIVYAAAGFIPPVFYIYYSLSDQCAIQGLWIVHSIIYVLLFLVISLLITFFIHYPKSNITRFRIFMSIVMALVILSIFPIYYLGLHNYPFSYNIFDLYQYGGYLSYLPWQEYR